MSTATHYEVQKSSDNSNWMTVSTVVNPITQYYSENSGNSGLIRYFRVRAIIKGIPQPNLPLISSYSTVQTITPTYVDSSEPDGFELYKSTNGVDFTLEYTATANETQYYVPNTLHDTYYWFKVKAFRRIPLQTNLPYESAFCTNEMVICYSIPDPSYSVEESVSFNTYLIKFNSKKEQRFPLNSIPKKAFKLKWKVLSQTDKQILQDFFIERMGSFKSFQWVNKESNITYTVRFKEDIMNAGYFSYLLWEVNQIELVEVSE